MQNLKLNTIICLLISLILLCGCGLGDSKDKNLEVYDLGQLKGTCKFDTKKLSKILSQNIMTDIGCLESNLNQFVDFVKREEVDYINREQLQQFIKKFFPENTATISEMLSLVYQINSLLLKDPEDKIHVKNLPLFFNIFRVVNIDGRALSDQFKNLDKDNYWQRREDIFESISNLTGKTLSIIEHKQANNNIRIDIKEFMNNIKDLLNKGHGESDIDFSMIDCFLFIKKLFFGGNKNIITAFEFDDVLDKIPGLISLINDVRYAEGKTFNGLPEQWYFYQKAIEELKSFFQPFDLDEMITDHDELMDVLETFCKDQYDIENIGKSIIAIKPRLVGGDPSIYTFADVNTIMGWGIQLFESYFFNEITWDSLGVLLEKNKKYNNLEMPDIPEYNLINSKRLHIHWKNFNQITKQFRLFQDSTSRINYSYSIKRTRKGYNTITTLRWGLKKLLLSYGTQRETGLSASKDQLRTVVYDLEGILRELNIWQEDTERFITEVTGGSDNFQYQANGDGHAGLEEATEYFQTIFAASSIRESMHIKLQAYCPLTGIDGDSFEVSCYRGKFFKIFFDELGLGGHYPLLKKYISHIGPAKALNHLRNMENYSRIISDPDLAMTKTDMSRLIIGLSNIETLVIRYDKNHDGQLKGKELKQAFKVFKKLIIQVGGLDNTTKFLAKSIFLYMVKKMEKPSITKLLAFHFFGKKKNIKAKRFNVGAILSFFVSN
jgi:hypothetical protein